MVSTKHTVKGFTAMSSFEHDNGHTAFHLNLHRVTGGKMSPIKTWDKKDSWTDEVYYSRTIEFAGSGSDLKESIIQIVLFSDNKDSLKFTTKKEAHEMSDTGKVKVSITCEIDTKDSVEEIFYRVNEMLLEYGFSYVNVNVEDDLANSVSGVGPR